MSEPAPAAPEPSKVEKRTIRLLIYSLVGVLLLILFSGDLELFFDFIFSVVSGWWKYLAHVVPKVRFNSETAVCSMVALVLATMGLHRVLQRWRIARGNIEKWRASWTLRITAMLLLLFATSIAATGIVHQVGWLFKAKGVVYNASIGRATQAMQAVHQIMLGVKMYAGDHEGSLPDTLEDLLPRYCTTNRIFFVRMDQDEPPERVVYFPGYKETDSQDTIIVISPRPIGGQRAIGQNDHTAKLIDESEFQARMQQQFVGRLSPPAARAIPAR